MKLTKFLTAIAVIAILLAALAMPVFAQEVGGEDPVVSLIVKVVSAVFTVLAILAVRFLHTATKKSNSEFLRANEGLLEQLALQGIAFAEEKAASYAKAKAGSSTMSNNQKLAIAAGYVNRKWPGLNKDEAESLIEAMLGSVEGVGASGTTAVRRAS